MRFELSDGTHVRIRRISADDKPALAAGHSALSDESRRLRYLVPKPRLSDSELRYLTEVDGHDHIALVAVLEDEPERIIGVARAVRLAGQPDAAEFAIVVGDPWQRRGLGGRLASDLADLARAEGIARFTATMLPENVAAHRLAERISGRLERARPVGGVAELSIDLAA